MSQDNHCGGQPTAVPIAQSKRKGRHWDTPEGASTNHFKSSPEGSSKHGIAPKDDGIIVSPRRGKDNSPLAETTFDFLTSDVLVDYSTYAPCVFR